MATVLITGGTGLIGKPLIKLLIEKGYNIIVLSRKPVASNQANIRYAIWDIDTGKIDIDAIKAADHIIHLAGENVAAKRWTKKRKQEIAESRSKSSELIVKSLSEIPNKVQTVISASAIGWYGPDNESSRQQGFKEDATADASFLGETCRRWEHSIQPVKQLGKRLVIFRQGIVLSYAGSALEEYKKPMRFGIAPVMANGRQMVSWIQIDDLCGMYLHAIENRGVQGVYNAVSPDVVSNRQLVSSLAGKMRGKSYITIHVPAFVLKVMLGEMSIEVLKSITVNAEKIQSTGFRFLYPDISSAIGASV